MSLINDALRKAQQERLNQSRTTPGQAPVDYAEQPLSNRPQASGLSKGLALGAAITAIGAAIVILVVSFTGQDTPQNPTAPVRVANQSAALPPPAPAPAPESPPVEPPSPPPPPAVATTAPEPVENNTTPPADAAAPIPRIGLLTPEQIRIRDHVNSLRITGVRGTGTAGRAMIAGRLYREGDIIEPELGIVLERIEATSLVFTDMTGYEFRISF
jgi:hypothetical protein